MTLPPENPPLDSPQSASGPKPEDLRVLDTEAVSSDGPTIKSDNTQNKHLNHKKKLLKRLVTWPLRVRDDVEDRWGNITQEWDRIRGGTIARYLFFIKIILLHARYIFGYLAAGFLVSAPLWLGTKMAGDFKWDGAVFGHIFYSVVTGLICLIPFVILIPVTRIDWENMRVPEFKIFELALARWAAYVTLIYLVICFNASAIFGRDPKEAWWFDLQIAWINFTLMVSSWAKIKIQTLIFKDFYDLEIKEDLILQRDFDDENPASNSAAEDLPHNPNADSENQDCAADSENRSSAADSENRGSAADSESRGSAADSESQGSTADSESQGSTADSESRGSAADSESRGSAADSESRGSAADSESRVRRPNTN